MESPTFRRAPDGTLLLTASPAARALGLQQPAGGQTSDRAKTPEEVDAEAWAHVASEGGDTNNATLVLSRWKVQFGRYQGKTFHWLLENDVGYSVNLVASHQKERERTGSQSPLMANKDAFTRYSSTYPDFAEAVGFHRAFEESWVRSLQPGQEGQALVGFGDFKFETLQSLYESEDSQKIRFVNYLRRKAPAPGTQMENAVRYIKSRDRQRAAGAATSTTSSSSSSTASVPAAMKAKSALQFAAFVSGQRSPSAVEMQAKVKKLVPLRPAFPASSRPALPSTSSAFKPSDKELVTAVVDIKESSDVQAPLLLCPYPPPPATAAAAATSIASSAAAAATAATSAAATSTAAAAASSTAAAAASSAAAAAATSAAAAAAATSAAAAAAATSAAAAAAATAATTAAATSAAAPAAAASRAAAVAAASAAATSAAAASAAAAAATSAAAAKAAAATGPSSSNVVFFFLYQPQPGPSSQGLPPMLPSPPPSTTRTLAPAALPHPLPVAQRVPRTTAFRKRKAAEAVAAGVTCPPTKARRQSGQYTCSRCGKPKRIETGHTRIAGVSYCATVGGKTVEEWREEMKKKKKEGQVLFLK